MPVIAFAASEFPEDEPPAEGPPSDFDQSWGFPSRRWIRRQWRDIPRSWVLELLEREGTLEEVVADHGAHFDTHFGAYRARDEAVAGSLTEFIKKRKRRCAVLARQAKRVRQHEDVAEASKPWTLPLALGASAMGVLGLGCLVLGVESVAVFATESGLVQTKAEGRVIGSIPILTSGVAKALYSFLGEPLYQRRFAIALGVGALLSGIAWIFVLTGEMAMPEVDASEGSLTFGDQNSGGGGMVLSPSIVRCSLSAEICGGALIWLWISRLMEGRNPFSRRDHPDLVKIEKKITRAEGEILEAETWRAKFTGRVKEIDAARRNYIGLARSACRDTAIRRIHPPLADGTSSRNDRLDTQNTNPSDYGDKDHE